jgi:hypothetical protein
MKFLRRLFGRKAPPTQQAIVDRREMNEDWQIGDLAECIADSWHIPDQCSPRVGDILRVSGVIDGTVMLTNVLVIALRFEGKPANMGWICTGFRKLRPLHEPCEADFKALIKQPRKVRA